MEFAKKIEAMEESSKKSTKVELEQPMIIEEIEIEELAIDGICGVY